MQMAKSTYIALLDDDDHWLASDHLAVAVKHLDEQKADFYFANMQGESHGKVTIRTGP
ncbi:MAG: glycosyltransferase family 2 protein [Phycisphaerales bacterium]|nr:glycosyltransferase family 2 protein [Phycisphaerales bacterium]